jgi:hypothetical protein
MEEEENRSRRKKTPAVLQLTFNSSQNSFLSRCRTEELDVTLISHPIKQPRQNGKSIQRWSWSVPQRAAESVNSISTISTYSPTNTEWPTRGVGFKILLSGRSSLHTPRENRKIRDALLMYATYSIMHQLPHCIAPAVNRKL